MTDKNKILDRILEKEVQPKIREFVEKMRSGQCSNSTSYNFETEICANMKDLQDETLAEVERKIKAWWKIGHDDFEYHEGCLLVSNEDIKSLLKSIENLSDSQISSADRNLEAEK